MEIYLDTADIDAIRHFQRILPIAGVTTNPTIVAASGKKIHELLRQLREVLGESPRLFAQVLARQAETMVEEAHYLRSIDENLVVKVPVTVEGLAAMNQLKQEGVPLLGTAVYSASQGLLAAAAGAQYIAPYVNRLDALSGNGTETVITLNRLLQLHAPQTKILAASFKNCRQVIDCLIAGAQAVTVPVDVAGQLIASPATDSALNQFEKDWCKTYQSLNF
ncbi:fructose-6-phosphate aldolase [Vibrio gazogenes]|uniref:Fructose-6-phosphate aldolase 1 n=1 Tax=Vibrio gazogenes DSM 21264 = NBRC 103151 TaxID=1123492 RepID=A0A1M5EXK5_VIBGA|nr:fructose-6-phosphate aldolase [Vibrio gazogenes]USP14777.1 fructose-6-phosphate aldolase [Vibrio gazogenes]SHF84013.1 fructose-6-phosphate aldolase 1 [Vibrio gazogenes DSM 21264] [Vibrio gazogenes DSM 21264 = NBRC 103151]SJN55158.1 Fructose-6-phosphate aldolase 1 [Vibrio gazogenes]